MDTREEQEDKANEQNYDWHWFDDDSYVDFDEEANEQNYKWID